MAELLPVHGQETGGQLAALEGKLEDDVKVEAKAMAAVKGIKDSMKAEEKKTKQLQKSLTDVSETTQTVTSLSVCNAPRL